MARGWFSDEHRGWPRSSVTGTGVGREGFGCMCDERRRMLGAWLSDDIRREGGWVEWETKKRRGEDGGSV